MIILEYLDSVGFSPFRSWLEALPFSVKGRVQAKVFRFEIGNLGDYRSVGGGVCEARMHFQRGYRIYFGFINSNTILLLHGGDKRSQTKDISLAKVYWRNYKQLRRYV